MCLSLLCRHTGHTVSDVPGPCLAKDKQVFSVFPMPVILQNILDRWRSWVDSFLVVIVGFLLPVIKIFFIIQAIFCVTQNFNTLLTISIYASLTEYYDA